MPPAVQACDKLGTIRRVVIADDVMTTSATLDALCQCPKQHVWRGAGRFVVSDQSKPETGPICNGTSSQGWLQRAFAARETAAAAATGMSQN